MRKQTPSSSGANIGSSSHIVSAQTLAKLLDLTTTRIGMLAKEGKIPRISHGSYPLWDCIRAYILYLRRENSSESGGPRARLDDARAQIAELKLEETKRSLINFDDALNIFGNNILAARARLLAIEAEFDDPQTRQKVRYEIRNALSSLVVPARSEVIKELKTRERERSDA